MKKTFQSSQLLFCFIALMSHQIGGKRDYTIDISEVQLKVNDWSYVTSLNHNLFGRKVVYIEFTLLKNVTDFDIKLTFDMIKKDNRHMNIIKLDVNGCESLESAHNKMNFLKVIFREIFRVSNIPKKCPLYANNPYFFKNYTIKDDDYPPIFPIMEWQLKIDLLVKRQSKAVAIIEGRVRKL